MHFLCAPKNKPPKTDFSGLKFEIFGGSRQVYNKSFGRGFQSLIVSQELLAGMLSEGPQRKWGVKSVIGRCGTPGNVVPCIIPKKHARTHNEPARKNIGIQN